MRRALAIGLVGALVLAGVPLPVGGIHESDGQIGDDDRHGDLFVPSQVTTALFLHCIEVSGDLGTECDDGGAKTFQAAGIESNHEAVDDSGGPGAGETSLTYRFVRSYDGADTAAATGDIERVEPILVIQNQLSTSGDFRVQFFVDGTLVGESDPESVDAGQTSTVSFPIDLSDDPVTLQDNTTMEIKVLGEGSWNLLLHGSQSPSRVELTGQLLRTRSWLEPPEGGAREAFDLTGSEAARSFRPLMDVRSALGPGMVWPASDGHDHAGGTDDTPIPDASLRYTPLDEGIDSSDPVSEDNDCDRTTQLTHDHANSSIDRPLLYVDLEGVETSPPCTIDRDTELAGNWTFDFELSASTFAGVATLRCNGDPGCVDPVDVELRKESAFALALDDDDGFKEVLAGEPVHYNLRLENRLASELTFALETDGPEHADWTAALSDDQVTVGGGESVAIDLTVTPPASASTNEDGTTTVTASSPGFSKNRSVAVTTIVGAEATFDASVFDDEASAGLGERATFLTQVTNDGNTRETFALSVRGVPSELSVTLPRSTLTLDAGEREQVRVHVDVPDEVSEELLDSTQPLLLQARSTSADQAVGNGTLTLNILASYGFEADAFHPTHQVQTATGSPDPEADEPCLDSVGNTTFGSWYRVSIENTGGLADEIDVTNLTPVLTDGEDPGNWEVAAYRAPSTTPDPDEAIDEPVDLPSGLGTVQFYLLVNRTDRDADDDGIQDQCDDTPGGDAWQEGDAIRVTADLISRNQPGIRSALTLRLEAQDDTFEPGVELERHLYNDTDGDGFDEIIEIPKLRPMPPGETQQLEIRFTNTGSFGCRGDQPYQAFLTGIPWSSSVNASRLGPFTGLRTPGSGTDGDVTSIGDDGGNLNVTFEDRLLQINVTVDEQAEAGETFEGEIHIEATCDLPNSDETAAASHSIPIEFVVTEKEDMEVSTLPSTGEIEVLPGREAMVNVVVENTGSTRPTTNLSIASSSLPSGWEARIAGLESLEIPPLSRAIVPVGIQAPADASPGEVGNADIRVEVGSGDLQETVPVSARAVDRGDLSIAADSQTKAVEPGGTVLYNVTVTNEGSADVTIDPGEHLTVRGVPTDWVGSIVDPDTRSRLTDEVLVEPGESLPVGVELQAADDELAASSVATTLVVDRPPNGTVAATVQTHIASEFGVSLSAVPASLAVRPEDSAQYKLRVHHEGNGVDTIDLTHEDPPSGWSVTIPEDRQRLVLGPFQTTSVPVTVDPPDDAPAGLTVPIQVTATSATRPSETDRLTLSTTVASYDPEIRADPTPRRVGPGQAMNFPITVVNNGTGTDTIEMSTSALPKGWRAEFSRDPLDLEGGEAVDLTVEVTPSPTAAARSDNVVIVQADSTFAPEKSDSVTFEVSIADYIGQDVDGDGIPEAAVDTDENVANGFERFQETDRRNGIVSGEVAAYDGDGDGKPDFYVDVTGDGAPDISWSPVGEVVTETIRVDIQGNGVDDFLADGDGDEIVDAVYRPDEDAVYPATSLDVDGDLEPEYLADSTGDERFDRYVDTGDPRPGYMVRTATAIVSEGTYAVDTDGDGSHDTIVDTQARTTRTFTLADAAVQLVTSYWYAVVLFALVVVLFGAVRLSSPRQRYIYQDHDGD